MENLDIRRVTVNEIIQLQIISRQTFLETFSAVNDQKDMRKYLEESLSLEKLTTELKNENSEFYFALTNSNIVGYLKLNVGDSQTELKDNKAVEIERIYVLQEFHGKKVGHLLYEKAIQVAKQRSAQYVWLGVWEENNKAIAFYKKNGFIEFDKHIFRLGNDKQTDIMMKLQL